MKYTHTPRYSSDGSTRSNLSLKKILVLTAALLAMAVFYSPRSSAQAVYGEIFGTVTDTTGAVIPNATIAVTDISKNTTVTGVANGDGEYHVQHLIPDVYRVVVTAPGFNKNTVEQVQVYADTQPKVDVKLAIGAVANTVQVTAAAPLLQTAHTDVNTILNARALENLPNFNRNMTEFELLTPGTSYIGWSVGQSDNPQQSEQIEVNGQLPFATGYELDGTDNQDPIEGVAVINPNLDAVSELKITSQNYEAELGGSVAGMVTAQTKSGANEIHGTAFEFRRSDAQQARDPFTEYQPNSLTNKYIPATLQNMFGGSVGGPIRKDKIFFFGDYQGVRQKTGSATQTTVPTLKAETTCTNGSTFCDLSEYLNPGQGGGPQFQAYDPSSNPTSTTGRTEFANNMIPVGDLSAPAINLIKEMPAPNVAGNQIFNNYVAFGSGIFNTDQFDVRVDGQASEKFHSFGRYTRFNSDLSGAPYFGAAGGQGFGAGGFAGTDNAVDQSVAAGGDYALSQRWLTDFRFGWFRVSFNEVGPGYDQPLGNQLGIPNTNVGDLSLNGGLPQFSISVPANGQNNSSSVTYGTSTNQTELIENQYQLVNNWTRIAGNHIIKFGGDIRYAKEFQVGINNNQLRSGFYGFSGTTTSGGTSSGLGYATFLLGDISNFNRTQTSNTNAMTYQKRGFFYAQDQWRATNNLTLTYGLRWDLIFPETVNGKGMGGLLNLDTGNVQIAGYGPYGTNMNVAMNYKELAPRVGLAYQLDPKTVLRAGYGRAYGIGWSGDLFGDVLTLSPPIAVDQSVNPVTSVAPLSFTLQQGPPGYTFPTIPASGNYFLPNGVSVPTRPTSIRLPTLDAWNLMLQRQITPTSSLQIGYVGSHGYHNMFDSSNQADPNQPTLNGFGQNIPGTTTPATIPDRQPYYNGDAQQYFGVVGYGHPFGWTQTGGGAIRYNANQATTSYQALQVVANKSYSKGFQLQASYVWSKARAHESDYFFIDSHADYGNSYYNRPQQFLLNGNWNLPFGHNQAFAGGVPVWVNEVIGGFALNGNLTWEQGLSFTPSYSLCAQDQDIDGQGGTLCRPNAVAQNFHLGAQGFNPVGHYEYYFTPQPLLANNGSISGPYQRPAAGTFGNIERGSFFGPSLISVDAALAKSFQLNKRVNFKLTVQAFNLFNHPNLGGPSGCVDCGSSSGQITDVVATQEGSSMRRLQFAGNLQF